MECQILKCHIELIKHVNDDHIDEQRSYIQKLYRDNKKRYGIPLKVIPIQSIALQTNNSILNPVYMLEFHPSLALISTILSAVSRSLGELIHMHQPQTTVERITLELHLIQKLQKLWKKTSSRLKSYSSQVERDNFSDLFIEDPLFVCEVGKSLSLGSSSSIESPAGRFTLLFDLVCKLNFMNSQFHSDSMGFG